jgi:peroxiredoxin
MKRSLCRTVLVLLLSGSVSLSAVAPAAALNMAGAVPEVGAEAPDFSLPDIEGKSVALGDFRGKPILLVFCSCYTDTCCSIVSAVDDLVGKYGERGLVVPIVCAEIPKVLKEEGYAGLTDKCGEGHLFLVDEDRKAKGSYKVRQLPTSFLVDRDMIIRSRVRGVRELYNEEFRRDLEELLPR